MTTPSGKLAWGQAGIYDAIDDRTVISAVTRGRLGLVRPVEVAAGVGLQIIVTGGWLGVASCNDRTSAVVGSREDQVVMAVPGPGTGSRTDVLWCDTEPDEGIWELNVIPLAAAFNRPGIPLASIQVPAGANVASQMDIRAIDASIERRLMAYQGANRNDGNLGYADTTWNGAALTDWAAQEVEMEPGQWYRVRFVCSSARSIQGPTWEARIGVGWRTAGQAANQAILAQQACIRWIALGAPQYCEVEWVFRYPKEAARSIRVFSGRMWMVGTGGIYQSASVTGPGDNLYITVEDIGS
jgi:hypothetical protein